MLHICWTRGQCANSRGFYPLASTNRVFYREDTRSTWRIDRWWIVLCRFQITPCHDSPLPRQGASQGASPDLPAPESCLLDPLGPWRSTFWTILNHREMRLTLNTPKKTRIEAGFPCISAQVSSKDSEVKLCVYWFYADFTCLGVKRFHQDNIMAIPQHVCQCDCPYGWDELLAIQSFHAILMSRLPGFLIHGHVIFGCSMHKGWNSYYIHSDSHFVGYADQHEQ